MVDKDHRLLVKNSSPPTAGLCRLLERASEGKVLRNVNGRFLRPVIAFGGDLTELGGRPGFGVIEPGTEPWQRLLFLSRGDPNPPSLVQTRRQSQKNKSHDSLRVVGEQQQKFASKMLGFQGAGGTRQLQRKLAAVLLAPAAKTR